MSDEVLNILNDISNNFIKLSEALKKEHIELNNRINDVSTIAQGNRDALRQAANAIFNIVN